MSNYFDQFDAATAAPAAPAPPASPSPAPAPTAAASLAPSAAPASPATQPTQSASPPNFFDQFDQSQQGAGRDALGGYLLPPQQPDPAQASQPTTFLGKVGHAIDSGVRSVEQGATFGFGDEINAAEQAAEQPLTGTTLGGVSSAPSFSQRYSENLAAERARNAQIPTAVAIPGQIIGGGALIAAEAPAIAARGVMAGARLIPGVGAVADTVGAAGGAVANALSDVPVLRYAVPVAKSAATGAAYGAAQGFGDGEGGLENRLDSAGIGGATGAVLGPVVEGAANVAGKGISAAGRMISESGYGAKAPILDAAGKPIVGTDNQPVVATPGVARVAGQQIADTTTDLPAAKAALDAQAGVGWGTVDPYPAPDGNGMTTIPPDQFAAFKAGEPPPVQPPAPVLPGDRPTTFQVTGDYGQGQKELELRNTPGTGNTPGPSQAFLQRSADQNAVRVNAISQAVPPEASSADLTNNLTAQQTALAAQRDAAAATARTGTLQDVGGATDSTPTQAGATLRGAIDQTRAPAVQVADQAVQLGQTQAAGAASALGGTVPAGTEGTAAQQFGRQFRGVLDENAQSSKGDVSRLYDAIDPDGTLAVNMQPTREAGQTIVAQMPENAAPLAGEERAIFDTVGSLPDAQSFRELGALNKRVTTAMRAARSDPAQGESYARLSQLRGAMADIMQNAVEGQGASDAAAVQAGTMAPEDSMLSRMRAHLAGERQNFLARQSAAVDQAGSGNVGDLGGYPNSSAADVYPAGGGQGPARGRSANSARNQGLQGGEPLAANADQAALDRITAANSGYAEHKRIYGEKAPGVGPVLAPGPTAGTFKMLDSAVPSAIFSGGAGAAERVQAAIRAGLTPEQIGQYAAFDLRRTAGQADGTLDPAGFTKWRRANGEALQALSQASPAIGRNFDTAQQAASRLADLQAARTAMDATHPLKPGWGDAEVMQRVWQPGPKGADSVRAATSAAGGSPVAGHAIADYAAYSLRKFAAPDGVLDPAKYATWVKNYDGALSVRPDVKAQFNSLSEAQKALNTSAFQHAQALKDFQSGVARHFLGGADPADTIGRILNSTTRQRDMADLGRLTANDPDARAGIQRAVVDHIFNRLQGNSLAGNTGIERLKSDQFQSFVNRAGPALHEVMTPQQVDTLRRVALTLQRDNTSIDATRVQGGSDSTQKASLVAAGPGATLLRLARAHGLTGLMTILGARMGPVGAFMGNKGGQALAALKTAGIRQTGDLVKEAMLNPALAHVLLENLTPSTEKAVAHRVVGVMSQLAAKQGAHTAVAVQHIVSPPSQRSASTPAPSVPINALAGLGSAHMAPARTNALMALPR